MKQTARVLMLLVFLAGLLRSQEAGAGEKQDQTRCGEKILFQFPESEEQARRGELWKVDFQELVNTHRLDADLANSLFARSERAKEADGKLVEAFKLAFDGCARKWVVEYSELVPPSASDQIWPAAMQVAASAFASQQSSVGIQGGSAQRQKSSSAGKFLRTLAFPLGFAHPLAGAGASALAGQFDRGSGGQSSTATAGEGHQEAPNEFQPPTYADRWVGFSSSKIR